MIRRGAVLTQLFLQGAVALAFGATLLFWHHTPFALLVVLFGTYALLDGAIALTFGTRFGSRRSARLHVFEGLVGVGLGLDAIACAPASGNGLLHLVASWAIGTGVLKVGTLLMAIIDRCETFDGVLRALGGGVSVLLGFWSLILPGAAAPLFIIVLGPYAVILGSVLLWLGARLRWSTRPAGGGTRAPDEP